MTITANTARVVEHAALGDPSADLDHELPRATPRRTPEDRFALLGSAAGSLALVWLLYTQVLPLSGGLGFLLLWFAAFLGMYAWSTAQSQPRPVVVDRVMSAVVVVGALVVATGLVFTIGYTLWNGRLASLHLQFFTHDMAGVRPTAPYRLGGVLHAVVGSLIEVGIAVAISLPLGIATAVYMNEVGGSFAKYVRTTVEAMTALPDVLAGLFVYALYVITLGQDKSGFAAALALSVTGLPIIARSADVVLRVVPGGLREAGLALGASQWSVVRRVVLPTARPGLATALILGVARMIGETAPVLLVSGASTFFHTDPLHEPMNSLPLYVYSAVRSGEPSNIARGFGAASVLLVLVLLLFTATRLLARTRVGRR